MNFKKTAIIAAVAGAAVAISSAAFAGGMPKKTAWTAYGTTSSGYAQAVAIGNMMKKHYGTNMRVIPGKNDISRMAPLRDNKAGYCACGIAAYFGLSLATAKDAGVKTMADMKGKRVSWVQGAPALNWNVGAQLAFAGLTWDDVQKVKVSGFGASFDAIINGQSDAAFSSTVSPSPKKLAASPRGLRWVPVPHDDAEGWKRMSAAAPVYVKVKAKIGSEIDKKNPPHLSNYPYPILVANESWDAGEVYAIVKAMVEHYDDYKSAAKGALGWKLDNQNMQWAMPYHAGAIKFFKEAGKWDAAAQKHQDMLVGRQAVIKKAWDALAGKDSMSKDELKAAWKPARIAALEAAGLDPIFK